MLNHDKTNKRYLGGGNSQMGGVDIEHSCGGRSSQRQYCIHYYSIIIVLKGNTTCNVQREPGQCYN